MDTLIFADAKPEDLWFSRNSSGLLISEIGSNDSVNLENWFTNVNYQNKTIALADGQHIESTQLQLLVEAMAAFSAGQDVSSMQPELMKQSMQMMHSSDYWSQS